MDIFNLQISCIGEIFGVSKMQLLTTKIFISGDKPIV